MGESIIKKLDMKFSVLVTVYYKDDAQFLQDALNSVIKQTQPPAEIVIVADGPLNLELDSVLAKFEFDFDSLVKVVSLPQNVGTGLAINEGLKSCSFDLVAKVDSDDICYFTRFEKQLKIFEENPQVSFVGAAICEFQHNNTSSVLSYRVLPEHHDDIVKYAKKRCPLNQPVVMYRKSAIVDCGGYNNFTFGEDYDLWVRAIMKGYRFYNIQEPLLYFRTNKNTIEKRGGFWYLRIDLAHHYDFYRMGFLSFTEFLYNSFIRIIVRLIPIKLRTIIYSKLLRSKTSP